MTDTPGRGSSVPALQKGMEVLEFLADQKQPVSLQEVASGLHRSRGELYRMVTWLVEQSYVVRLDDGDQYILGERIGHLFRRFPATSDIISTTRPLMDRICQSTGASCYLSISAAPNCVVIATTDSSDFYALSVPVGAVFSPLERPAGACLIAGTSQEETIIKGAEKSVRQRLEKDIDNLSKNKMITWHGVVGAGILEVAIAVSCDSQLRSAITAVFMVGSNKEERKAIDAISKLL